MDSIISRFLLAALLPTLAVAAPAPAQGDALPLMSRSDTLDLIGLEQSFRHVAQGVAPSVAAVVACAEPAPADADPPRSATLTADRLADLLGDGPRVVGTAFCVDADGYLVTNEHVVRDARQIYATLDDGRTYPALVVGTDPRSDLAVLKIPARLRPVSFAPPGSLQRGQWTITVGNPVGLAGGGELCMSVGVVGAVGRDLPRLSEREGRLYTNLIQTTAEVNPGNSGGPLFDLGGRVVGIVTAVVLPQGPAHGVGFAMPVDEAMLARIEQLKAGRAVTHGFLGVSVRDAEGGGVRVAGVGANTPAAGVLREGDVLLRIDGRGDRVDGGVHPPRRRRGGGAGRADPAPPRRPGAGRRGHARRPRRRGGRRRREPPAPALARRDAGDAGDDGRRRAGLRARSVESAH